MCAVLWSQSWADLPQPLANVPAHHLLYHSLLLSVRAQRLLLHHPILGRRRHARPQHQQRLQQQLKQQLQQQQQQQQR